MRGQYSVRGLRIDESAVGERGRPTNNICLAKSKGFYYVYHYLGKIVAKILCLMYFSIEGGGGGDM